jgi:hypothetical protein
MKNIFTIVHSVTLSTITEYLTKHSISIDPYETSWSLQIGLYEDYCKGGIVNCNSIDLKQIILFIYNQLSRNIMCHDDSLYLFEGITSRLHKLL